MPGVLNRTTFEMHRALEFFTERELQMQIGYPRFTTVHFFSAKW